MIDKDFLKGFRKRMQFVARYAMLCGNSIDRVVKWRSFGINEMLFKLHLEKADYNKAVDDIKNIFNQLRKQGQKILEAALTIKRNALSYSVEDYRKIMEENINTVADTRAKFNMHREFIDEKIKEFEEKEMNADELLVIILRERLRNIRKS